MCETFVNRSCCKTETLLRRTYTFDLVYFLYASLLCISKEKTVWGTLLQTNTFLQSSDKKSTSPILTQIKILGIYEKQRIKLDIFVNFVKKKQFSRFQTNNDFFFVSFFEFEGLQYFESNSSSFIPSCSLEPTNSCFALLKVILDRNLQTIFHPLLCEFLLSIV